MKLVFIGPPGAGKGTQAAKLSKRLLIPHLSTGEMLREAKRAQTEFGRRVAPLMDAGQLIGDELMNGIIRERLLQDDCAPGFLLDGYPRTIAQAEAFQCFLKENNTQLDHVIELHVSREELTRRLLGRAKTAAVPRADDTADAIPRRLEIYFEETQPLLDFYDHLQLLRRVEGTGTMDDVFHRILEKIRS